MTGGLVSGLKPSSFNEGNDGEIYITNMYRDFRRITGANAGGAGVATQLPHRLRERIERNAACERADSLRAERAVLVRRRREGALDGIARRKEHHRRRRR